MINMDYHTGLWAAQRDIVFITKLCYLLKDSVPQPWEAPIEDVLEICDWYYGYNGAGGSLHVVLDDGNLEDVHVDHAIKFALQDTAPTDITGYMLALLIRTMTEENREILYKKLHGHAL